MFSGGRLIVSDLGEFLLQWIVHAPFAKKIDTPGDAVNRRESAAIKFFPDRPTSSQLLLISEFPQ